MDSPLPVQEAAPMRMAVSTLAEVPRHWLAMHVVVVTS